MQRVKRQARLKRFAATTVYQTGAKIAKSCDLIVAGSPDLGAWVVPGGREVKRQFARTGKAKRRYLGREAVRSVLALRLQSVHNHLQRGVYLRHGVPAFSPHEGFTTNTCILCHVFDNENVRFQGRHRVCPNEHCPSHNKATAVKLHRELLSCINQPIAAAMQVDYLRNGELLRGLFADTP